LGRTFSGLKFQDWPNLFQTHPPEVFGQLLEGAQVMGVSRRAKYIVIELSEAKYLVIHRKMSGNLFWRSADAAPDKYTHIIFSFSDGSELRFADMRKFGRVYLFLSKAELDQQFSHLGLEPLFEDFTEEKFVELFQGRKGQLKQFLLNQNVLVGLGNIYVDESLWLSKLHPLRQVTTLTVEEQHRLHAAIREVLSVAVANRGTTFSDYLDGEGQAGRNQESLRVYERWGEPCLVCGTPISKIVVGQRGTHFCPHCQPVPEGAVLHYPKQKQPSKTTRPSVVIS
jgi:formamidopyrimidine-DNA glycosylase